MTIDFQNKRYKLCLSKIFNFVNYSDKHCSKETEITDGYDINDDEVNPQLTSRIVREITMDGNTQMDTLKYDMIKIMINRLIECTGETFDFGTTLAFNTLYDEGFLIEIEIN